MANEHALKRRPLSVALGGVCEYRATIPALVEPGDAMLGIGCEWGTTTALFAPRCREVVGTPACASRCWTPSMCGALA